jgi:hypothetical protein
MGQGKEHLIPIDESSRGWFAPTADDIGKKICVNCEDTMEEGYCRYAEVLSLYFKRICVNLIFGCVVVLSNVLCDVRLVLSKLILSCVLWSKHAFRTAHMKYVHI